MANIQSYIEELIEALTKLPGVEEKEQNVLHILLSILIQALRKI